MQLKCHCTDKAVQAVAFAWLCHWDQVGQWLHYVQTIEDFCYQSAAVIAEGLALLSWAKDVFPQATFGVTGLSWGGLALICSQEKHESPNLLQNKTLEESE